MPKKGENIYKRKDGRWEARYIKRRQPDGKIQYGYCYGKTYREAKQKVSDAKIALASGPFESRCSRKHTLADFCDEWLCVNRDNIKQSSYVKYNNMIEKHVKPALGDNSVHSLSTAAIEEFAHQLLHVEKLSAKTVKDILIMLHTIIKYMSKQLSYDIRTIEFVYPKISNSEMRVLSQEEQTSFVNYLMEDMDECKFGVFMALLTGMRLGELCALRWGNISLEEQTVKVKYTMQRLKSAGENKKNKTEIVLSEPKTSTSSRIIPLTDYTANVCKIFHCSDPDAFILTGNSDRFIEPRLMQYKLKKYTSECGLDGVHFHTLRHTFATRCVEVDFEIKTLSEILGHASPHITLERYVHSSIELKRNNMKKLALIGY